MSLNPGSEMEYKTNLVLLAMGILHFDTNQLVSDLGLELNEMGKFSRNENFMTIVEGVFAAGDSKHVASLVVWEIHQEKHAAKCINDFLKKSID
jgi:glutamate synthase (NADPH/NADH) small chain